MQSPLRGHDGKPQVNGESLVLNRETGSRGKLLRDKQSFMSRHFFFHEISRIGITVTVKLSSNTLPGNSTNVGLCDF